MSFSFTVTAASKAEMLKKIEDQLDAVARSQAPHLKDVGAANLVAASYINLVTVPDGHELHVSMHGSVSWPHDKSDQLVSASVGISVSVRKVAAP